MNYACFQKYVYSIEMAVIHAIFLAGGRGGQPAFHAYSWIRHWLNYPMQFNVVLMHGVDIC